MKLTPARYHGGSATDRRTRERLSQQGTQHRASEKGTMVPDASAVPTLPFFRLLDRRR
jgi:hypothetical protein